MVGRASPPAHIVSRPLQQLRASEPDASRLGDGAFLVHPLIKYQIRNERGAHPVTAGAVEENAPGTGCTEHAPDSFQGFIGERPGGDRHYLVPNPKSLQGGRFVERARLPWVPGVQDDLAARGGEPLQVGGGRLAARHDSRKGLAGVGNGREGLERGGHGGQSKR